MRSIAVFVSGHGTNLQHLIGAFEGSELAKIALVVSDKLAPKAFSFAQQAHIPTISLRQLPNPENDLLARLKEQAIDIIVLAGYLSKVPPALIRSYPRRILNLHPALLPKFGGKGMYGLRVHEAVLAAKEQVSGITIHFVNEEYDRGDIVFQAVCPVRPDDTPDSLAQRIHQLEYEHYPRVVRMLAQNS